MPAFVLFSGLLLFVAATVTHVMVWRTIRVSKEIFWLFVIFLLCPLLLVGGMVAIGYSRALEGLATALVHTSLAVVYIQTYPALREDIPSIRVLMLVDSHPEGIDRDGILRQLAGAQFLETKIDDLKNDALVEPGGGVLRLTRIGLLLATVFASYRALLGTESGQG